jgi:hypothetical protein
MTDAKQTSQKMDERGTKMQKAKLDLNNGLTGELFSSDTKKIRHLIKSCGKIVQTHLWGVYVHLDDNDTYPLGLLKD